ncbi:MAG TPA: metalloregulator ArsR/SmtB family transcription factor [Candidatus Acidoferrales bacterium]
MHEAAELFHALADSTRLAVFECVARREMTVSQLTNRFDVSQPAISQHLAALRDCGLVSQRKEGKYVYYRAKPAGVKPLVHWLSHYQAFWKERMPGLRNLLQEMKDE